MSQINHKAAAAHLLQFTEMADQGEILHRTNDREPGTIIYSVSFVTIGNHRVLGLDAAQRNARGHHRQVGVSSDCQR